MKRPLSGSLCAVAATLVALSAAVKAAPAGQLAQGVRLLDGTKIPPFKIERIVTRLMQAGRVTGLAIANGKAFFKEGPDDGWENHCVCYESPRSCIVLMSNSSNGDGIFKEVLEKVMGDRFTPWYWENYIPYGSRGSKKK